MIKMVEGTLTQLWNRLVNRYEPDEDDNCCEATVETATSRAGSDDTNECCE